MHEAFVDLDEEQQDQVLIALSGARQKPAKVTLERKEPVTTFLQGSFDADLSFFFQHALLHAIKASTTAIPILRGTGPDGLEG